MLDPNNTLSELTDLAQNISYYDETGWTAQSLDVVGSILVRLRFLFYIVLPSETMFSSLDQVPRYVIEVSWVTLESFISRPKQILILIHYLDVSSFLFNCDIGECGTPHSRTRLDTCQ